MYEKHGKYLFSRSKMMNLYFESLTILLQRRNVYVFLDEMKVAGDDV